jgi:tight adherence protein C
MEITVSILLFLILMSVIVLFGYRRYSKPASFVEQQIGVPVISSVNTSLLGDKNKSSGVTDVMQLIGSIIPASSQDLEAAKRDLVMAGYRSDNGPAVFSGLRILAALILLATAFIVKDKVTANPILRMVMIVAGGAIGYLAPGFLLDKKISTRQRILRLSLPDAIDLMVISVEAGLGMDQAISYVGKELQIAHPALSEELGIMSLEVRAGKRRTDALQNLAERTGEAELRKLVSVLTQTDRFGTSMANALRTHSEYLRIERRQQAEERAAKIGVKLVFPIFFFILPSMLLVTVGPGMLGLFKHLFPMMQEFSK